MNDAATVGEATPTPKSSPSLSLTGFDNWIAEQFKLYGALRKCRWRHWWEALSEFSLTLVFLLLPVWVPFIALPMFGHPINTPLSTIYEQVRSGELYVMATALLAPLYYFTFPQTRGGESMSIRPFPSQQLLILIFIITIIVTVLAVAAARVQAGGTGIPTRMVYFSEWLFAFCSLVFFLSLAVRNSLPEIVENSFDEQSRLEQERFPPPGGVVAGTLDIVHADTLVAETIKANAVKLDDNDPKRV